ncbi:MAG: hypothetical protein M1827_007474 [Pycnora praestabilis]|nr:MAG: hypothetical protein M1827_007474 [Pycnora praestabilis]
MAQTPGKIRARPATLTSSGSCSRAGIRPEAKRGQRIVEPRYFKAQDEFFFDLSKWTKEAYVLDLSHMRTLNAPQGISRVSKRLILSYVIDWVVILVTAGVGGAFSGITPNKRPFYLFDPEISFPYVAKEKVSTGLLVVLGLVVPAVFIPIVCFLFVPGPTAEKRTSPALIWRRKLWEWNTGWMGLGLSLAIAFLITDGVKNLIGKPRPDLLSRCNPDLANVAMHALGGYNDRVAEGTLVSWTICRNTDTSIMDDGFRSFPSGHSSFSWAGLTYLTLFLCSKFAIAIPFLAPQINNDISSSPSQNPRNSPHSKPQRRNDSTESTKDLSPAHMADYVDQEITTGNTHLVATRNQAAAPPTYLLVIAFLPIAIAIYVSTTRFSDFRHHGFDILFGSALGFVTAWFAFRWYHLPIRRGAGWSWGARSRERAFGIGVGRPGYVGTEGWASTKAIGDLETGREEEEAREARSVHGLDGTRRPSRVE